METPPRVDDLVALPDGRVLASVEYGDPAGRCCSSAAAAAAHPMKHRAVSPGDRRGARLHAAPAAYAPPSSQQPPPTDRARPELEKQI
jgi:hypothetical protein